MNQREVLVHNHSNVEVWISSDLGPVVEFNGYKVTFSDHNEGCAHVVKKGSQYERDHKVSRYVLIEWIDGLVKFIKFRTETVATVRIYEALTKA
jgi:hypothetical protein